MFKNGLLPHTYFTNLSAYFGSFLVVIPNIEIAACKNKLIVLVFFYTKRR